MSKAVKLRSNIEYKTMLLEGNPQFENFYKEELIDFCKIAKKIILEQEKENQQLKEQIDTAINFCNYLLENNKIEINNEKYYKHSCDDIITKEILQKLNKYKKEESE